MRITKSSGGLPEIGGPRVILRPFCEDDAGALYAVRSDAEVLRYLCHTSFTENDARGRIAQVLRTEPGTPGQWCSFAITLGKTGELIGDCSFRYPEDDLDQAEVGYLIGRKWWRQGYATEAVSGLVSWLVRAERKRRLFAVIDARNTGSRRVLEQVGFARDARLDRMAWCKGQFDPESVWILAPDRGDLSGGVRLR